jgi:hypothetical protein
MWTGAGLERLTRWVMSGIVTVFFLGLCAVRDQERRGHELYVRNWLSEPVTVSGVLRESGRERERFVLESLSGSLTDVYLLPRLDARHGGEISFETGTGPLPYRVPLEFHQWDRLQHGPVVISLYPDRFYITQDVPAASRPCPVDLSLERLLITVAVFGGTFTFLRWCSGRRS